MWSDSCGCSGHGDHGDHGGDHGNEGGDECRGEMRPQTYEEMKIGLMMMCSKCMTMMNDIGMHMDQGDMDGACAAGGPIEKFTAGVDCPAAEFDSLGFTNGDELITFEKLGPQYACMCDLMPLIGPGTSATCGGVDKFMAGDCTADGMKNMGMTKCEVDTSDDEPCPEDKESYYTKEEMRDLIIMMHQLSCS
jgi:hypothetical protein